MSWRQSRRPRGKGPLGLPTDGQIRQRERAKAAKLRAIQAKIDSGELTEADAALLQGSIDRRTGVSHADREVIDGMEISDQRDRSRRTLLSVAQIRKRLESKDMSPEARAALEELLAETEASLKDSD